MDMKRFFLYAIVIAALMLAGCGGNGGGGMTGPVDPTPTPTPDPCPEGQVGTPPNCMPAPPTVADLFATAQNAEDAATGAVKAATDAVKAATTASTKFKGLAVMGDSMMAQTNVQTVLDGQTTANNAVTTAETALSDLNQADKDADEHNNSTLDTAIANAIKVAEQAIKDAKAQATGIPLEDAVDAVTGPNANDPMTAADHAESVAKAVEKALQGTITHVNDGTNSALTTARGLLKPTATSSLASKNNDSQGRTWAEIVGASNLVDKVIANRSGAGTETVQAVSANGLGVVLALPTATSYNSGTQYNNADDTAAVNYRGIPGSIFCGGDDCKISAAPPTDTDNPTFHTLTGSWYFTPETKTAEYVRTDNDANGRRYDVDTLYAHYGYWLTGTANNISAVSVYAYSAGTNTTNDTHYDMDDDVPTLTDTKATYTGGAVGISAKRTYDSAGNVIQGSRQSGHFTADVTLDVTFGAAASVSGTIDNFTGDAVDSSWKVQLQSNTGDQFGDGNLGLEDGKTVASGADGQWTAQAYGNGTGENPARPTGVYGTFDANFSNGEAVGAYATRK